MLAQKLSNVRLTIQLVSVVEHSPSWFRRQPVVVQCVRYPSVRFADCSLGIRTTSDGMGPRTGLPGDPYLGQRALAGLGPDFQLDSLADVRAFRSISRQYDEPAAACILTSFITWLPPFLCTEHARSDAWFPCLCPMKIYRRNVFWASNTRLHTPYPLKTYHMVG